MVQSLDVWGKDRYPKAKSRLFNIIDNEILHGDFILSNYEKSQYFIDMANIVLRSDAIEYIKEIFQHDISNNYKAIAAISQYYGSLCLALRISSKLNSSPILVHPSPRIPVSDNVYDWRVQGELPEKGETIILVTPLVVTGESILRAANQLLFNGYETIIWSILDRSNNELQEKTSEKKINYNYVFDWSEFMKNRSDNLDTLDMKLVEKQLENKNMLLSPSVPNILGANMYGKNQFEKIDLKENKFDKVTVGLIQPSIEYGDVLLKNGFYYLSEKVVNKIVKESVNQIKSLKIHLDILVYPELIFNKSAFPFLQDYADNEDTIIIGGSSYVDKKNISIIILPNKKPILTEKKNISYIEKGIFPVSDPIPGKSIIIINSKIGNFVVPICYDIEDLDFENIIFQEDIDFVFNISLNSNSKRFYRTLSGICERHKNGVYCCYSNSICFNENNQMTDGNTSIFGKMHKSYLKKNKPEFPYNIFSLDSENIEKKTTLILIAEFNMLEKKPIVQPDEPNIKILYPNK